MKKVSIIPGNPQYRIVKIFESLQGGGWDMGMPTVFVRLGRYNLACGWCDTDYLKLGMMSLSDTLDCLKTCAARNIIITGGEPTIQPHLNTLLDALKAEGHSLCVETNGLRPTSPQIDYIAISPKVCYATKCEINCIVEADEVRVVAGDDIVAFCKNMERKIRTRHYYLSPCEQNSVTNIHDTIRQIGLLSSRPGASVHRQLSMQTYKRTGTE